MNTLSRNDVHVWSAFLGKYKVRSENFKAILSTDEKARAKRFIFKDDYNHFVIAHGLLRIILGSYLRINPEKVEFTHNQFGKPILAFNHGSRNLHFNMTHSNLRAMYAFAWGREVGIDIEYLYPIPDINRMIKRLMTTEEQRALLGLPNDLKTKEFLEWWTHNEAYLKALGVGLSRFIIAVNTDRLFVQKENTCILSKTTNYINPWSVKNISQIIPGYAASVVAQGNDWQLSFHKCP